MAATLQGSKDVILTNLSSWYGSVTGFIIIAGKVWPANILKSPYMREGRDFDEYAKYESVLLFLQVVMIPNKDHQTYLFPMKKQILFLWWKAETPTSLAMLILLFTTKSEKKIRNKAGVQITSTVSLVYPVRMKAELALTRKMY